MSNVLYELTFDWGWFAESIAFVLFFEFGLFLLTWQRKNQGVEVIRGRLYGSFPKTKEQVNSEKKFSIK